NNDVINANNRQLGLPETKLVESGTLHEIKKCSPKGNDIKLSVEACKPLPPSRWEGDREAVVGVS
ncbi:MAG: hypothetical protein PUE51_06510, partial [Veillonellaceae bacterium]|nr:hypothetical protein [Veillonellaceae bacterium]